MVSPNFKIVLVEPEIPQNTGNIGRTCVATNSELHLIGPMGFEISDKQLKRAGLDYWPHLKWFYYDSFDQWREKCQPNEQIFFFSTKAQKYHFQASFKVGDWLVFGKETKGLHPEILRLAPENNLKIPLLGPTRSLNLATSVAISVYEGIRQLSEL